MDGDQPQNASLTKALSSALDHKTKLTKIKIDKILRTTMKTEKIMQKDSIHVREA
jgi:hypothetical protein